MYSLLCSSSKPYTVFPFGTSTLKYSNNEFWRSVFISSYQRNVSPLLFLIPMVLIISFVIHFPESKSNKPLPKRRHADAFSAIKFRENSSGTSFFITKHFSINKFIIFFQPC